MHFEKPIITWLKVSSNPAVKCCSWLHEAVRPDHGNRRNDSVTRHVGILMSLTVSTTDKLQVTWTNKTEVPVRKEWITSGYAENDSRHASLEKFVSYLKTVVDLFSARAVSPSKMSVRDHHDLKWPCSSQPCWTGSELSIANLAPFSQHVQKYEGPTS